MDDKFQKRIQLLVDKAGGQSALARSTNMSLGAIQRYLKGGDPTRQALVRLAEAGNVTLSWLIFGEEGKMESSSHPQPKYKMFGFSDGEEQGWQKAFPYRVKTELDWPDPECFAVIASDNAFEDEGIKKDFTCYVSPNTHPQPDDIIFIKNKSGQAALKKYLREDSEWVYVKTYVTDEKTYEASSFEEQIKQNEIDQIAPVIFVKRR